MSKKTRYLIDTINLNLGKEENIKAAKELLKNQRYSNDEVAEKEGIISFRSDPKTVYVSPVIGRVSITSSNQNLRTTRLCFDESIITGNVALAVSGINGIKSAVAITPNFLDLEIEYNHLKDMPFKVIKVIENCQ